MSKSLSDSIKEAKKEQNVTNEQLAEVAGVSVSAVSKFLAGVVSTPSVYMVGSICAYLHISLDELLGIDVPNVHDIENQQLHARMDAGAATHAKIESFYLSSLARKDKIIRWLVIAVVVLSFLSVGSYLVWDLTHTGWGLFRG